MWIQELETLTGMDRSTIRFYEKEGLIQPNRLENGYRDYSIKDRDELMKIKLLRQLEVPLESIRDLQQGNEDLSQVLAAADSRLSQKAELARLAQSVCRQLQQSVPDYDSLDAPHYLAILEKPAVSSWGQPSSPQPSFRERVEREVHPVRRFTARFLDYNLLATLLLFLVYVVFRMRPMKTVTAQILSYASWWLLIPVEGILVHFLGTTPGKWVMGIRLEHFQGGKLSLSSSMSRAWRAFYYGMGLNIPVLNLFCMFKSRKRHIEYVDLDWDDEAEVCYTDWSVGLMVVVLLLILGLDFWRTTDSVLPKYRGEDLSVAEFSQNYNDYAEEMGFSSRLMKDGTWLPEEFQECYVIYMDGAPHKLPDYQYQVKDGVLRSITFEDTLERKYFEGAIPSYCYPAVLAVVGAQPGMGGYKLRSFYNEFTESIRFVQQFSDSVTWGNITVSWQLDPLPEGEQADSSSYRLVFSIDIREEMEQ